MDNPYIYQVNPFCPNCGKEHAYYRIQISEEEQQVLDQFYEEHKGEALWVQILSGPPLVVKRTFKCPVCKTMFEGNVGVNHVDRVGFSHPGYISTGTKPV